MSDAAGFPMTNASVKANPAEIPNKLYFRIGEVSRLVGVPTFVLRYWQTEFPSIGPKKSGGGHRLYRRKDVELLLEIKWLLYGKRYTIEGARQYLGAQARSGHPKEKEKLKQAKLFNPAAPALAQIRKELAAILELLHSEPRE